MYVYKRSLTAQSTVLLELAKGPFNSAKWAACIEKAKTKEEFLSDESNNVVSKAHLIRFLSDTSSAR